MSISKRLLSEFLGTASLLIAIVGSGIMGEQLSNGNAGVALIANSLATGAALFALIQNFGPISGAHFNPAISIVEWLWKKLSTKDLAGYISVQILGAVVGVWIAHFMFGQQILQLSTHSRSDIRFMGSEVVATFGLLLVIALSGKRSVETTPLAVALYVTSAYWFTSSTSFANPAVTIARSLTNTFSGILWSGAPGFIAAQLFGAALAFWVSKVFTNP